MSLSALQVPGWAADRDRRQLDRWNSPAKRALESVLEAVRVERGQEADLAVVDREHRHAGARIAAQRRAGSCRRRRARRRSASSTRSGTVLDPQCAGRPPCFRRLVGREASVTRLARAALAAAPIRRPRCRRGLGGCDDRRRRRLELNVFHLGRRRDGAAPRSASHMNVSRLPDGPSSAGGRRAHQPRPGLAGGGDRSGPPRGAGRDRGPRRPCRSGRGPTSNCGLTIARQSNALARGRPARRPGPWSPR